MNKENLMTVAELAEVLGAKFGGAPDIAFSSVEIDSRKVMPGALFFAIKAARDGHEFVEAAVKKGAVAAVVSHWVGCPIPQILVPDTRKALLQSATYWRQRFDMPVLAVAGSNGKTTTTQMIISILKHAYEDGQWLGTEGNLNNDMGAALMIWKMRLSQKVAVLEAGMNHPGEMKDIVKAIAPTIGTVTNAMRDHQEFLVSLEETAKENGEVFVQLPESGIAVINDLDPLHQIWYEQAGNRKIIGFGTPDSDVYADNIRGETFELRLPDGRLEITLTIPGIHNTNNAVNAAACAYALGIEPKLIKAGLEKFEAVAHRSKVIKLKSGSILVDDSYNANPDSMLAALEMLAGYELPKICVLGDMAELGSQSPALHAEIGKAAKDKGIETMLCTGVMMQEAANSFGEGARHFNNKEEMAKELISMLRAKPHAVLIKASNSSGLHLIIDAVAQEE
ncbi:MAG: UDP-N-acetylmuramoyl-tripeptide--D-alanyl-D-alanine ligase [Burkholderiales bacterium]|nr:UDP-N-acetylmuramoyl-tripeptide--D-alanyl-D-alanine ligase [Burkholderiales bacterium]